MNLDSLPDEYIDDTQGGRRNRTPYPAYIIALIMAGIISGFIISHNITEALDNLRSYSYYF